MMVVVAWSVLSWATMVFRFADTPAAQADSSRPSTEENRSDAVESQVIVYYFHRTVRCESCLMVEALTAKALEQFTTELEHNVLRWRPVNLDEPESEHYMDEYQLWFNAVVLVRETDGRVISWKDLGEKIWDLYPHEEEYTEFVTAEVSRFLADTKSGG
jgi:hypothetical protein